MRIMRTLEDNEDYASPAGGYMIAPQAKNPAAAGATIEVALFVCNGF